MKNNANLWTPNDELEVEFKTKYILIRNSSNTKVLAVRNELDLVELIGFDERLELFCVDRFEI